MSGTALAIGLAGAWFFASARACGVEPVAAPPVETYHYSVVPSGRAGGRLIETIEIGPATLGGERSIWRTIWDGAREVRTVRVDRSSEVLWADRKEIVEGVPDSTTTRIRREGGAAYTERARKGGIVRSDHHIPGGQPFAVDASLLLLMRSFPFGTDETWKVFMADFDQHFVTVSVRDDGVETITVPAGTFGCYRMAVTVQLILIKPRIWFWVTQRPPHFLVRQRGRTGPFTPTYDTSLVSFEIAPQAEGRQGP